MDSLQAALDLTSRDLEEFVEEHSREEGLLADALNDRGKVTKVSIKGRLKEIESESETDNNERDALNHCLALLGVESDVSRSLKEAQATLDDKILAKYAKLTEADIKSLVIEDKWFTRLAAFSKCSSKPISRANAPS